MRVSPAVLSLVLALLAPSAAGAAPAQMAAPAAQPVPAASALPAAASSIAELAPITVSGVQPGPGLWKVSRGDHVLWIMGTLSPLPRSISWQSQEVAEVIAGSQQVLLSPTVKMKLNAGFFGKLFLLPAAFSARKNEGGKTLQQVLPASDYARWLVLKKQYIGADRGIERWRPIFASAELYRKALKANGLSNTGGIEDTVKALAKQHGITPTTVAYHTVIEQPRAAIKAFVSSGLDDTACFSHTLDSIEQDLPAMTARANAWASGDLETLRKLPDSDRRDTCVNALTSAGFARKLGLDDLPERIRDAWLDAARQALASNAQTFALLPIDELLSPTGWLAQLKAQGYAVEAPDDAQPGDDAPAADASAGPAPSTSVAY